MHYETTITPSAGRFGEYDCNTPNGEGWDSETDLLSEMRSNLDEAYVLGKDDLPDNIEDIRGRIHNEPGTVIAARTDGVVRYFGIVERD